MTTAGAQKFIQQTLWDRDLVCQVNGASDREALAPLLVERDMSFNYEEFEESCNHLLTQCQTHEQAETIKEIKLWWDCLGCAMGPPGGQS